MSKPRKPTEAETEPETKPTLDDATAAVRAAEVIIPEYGVSLEEISRRSLPKPL